VRGILLSLIIAASLPVILVSPYVGVLVFSWVSYMNPHRLTWGFASGIPWTMIVGVLTFAAWFFSRENKKPPMTTITVLTVIFVVWCGITTALAYNKAPALAYYIQYVKIMAMTFLTMILIQDQRRLNLLIWVIVVSIGFFGFRGGLFSLLTGGQFLVWGPPASFIADNNALAVALIMVAPLVRYLQLRATNRWIRLGLLASLPCFLVSIITTYSRGAFLGLGVTMCYLAMKSRHRIRFGILIAVVLVGSLSLMPDKFFQRMDTIETYDKDASALSRLNAWYFAWNIAVAHPITGGGFDVFDYQPLWPRYAPNSTNVQAAHSIYFQVMETQGFVGLFLFLTIFFLAYRANGWVVKRTKHRPDLQWLTDLGSMMQVGLVGFGAAGVFQNLAFFDLPWHFVAISVIARLITQRELAKPPPEAEAAPTRDARQPRDPRRRFPPLPQPVPAGRAGHAAYNAATARRLRRG